MGKPRTASEFVEALAAENRVIMLGGLAVIAHGFSRTTQDSDVWLDPAGGPECWFERLDKVMSEFSGVELFSISQQKTITSHEAMAEGEGFGMIRLSGLNMPLDIFYRASECRLEEFETFWKNGSPLTDNTRLPHPIDLYLTKINTGRDRDTKDLHFLETLIEKEFADKLPRCTEAEARNLFERYANPQFLEKALENPDAGVREYALEELRSFEAEGDPFSRDILAEWDAKNAG